MQNDRLSYWCLDKHEPRSQYEIVHGIAKWYFNMIVLMQDDSAMLLLSSCINKIIVFCILLCDTSRYYRILPYSNKIRLSCAQNGRVSLPVWPCLIQWRFLPPHSYRGVRRRRRFLERSLEQWSSHLNFRELQCFLLRGSNFSIRI